MRRRVKDDHPLVSRTPSIHPTHFCNVLRGSFNSCSIFLAVRRSMLFANAPKCPHLHIHIARGVTVVGSRSEPKTCWTNSRPFYCGVEVAEEETSSLVSTWFNVFGGGWSLWCLNVFWYYYPSHSKWMCGSHWTPNESIKLGLFMQLSQ